MGLKLKPLLKILLSVSIILVLAILFILAFDPWERKNRKIDELTRGSVIEVSQVLSGYKGKNVPFTKLDKESFSFLFDKTFVAALSEKNPQLITKIGNFNNVYISLPHLCYVPVSKYDMAKADKVITLATDKIETLYSCNRKFSVTEKSFCAVCLSVKTNE